ARGGGGVAAGRRHAGVGLLVGATFMGVRAGGGRLGEETAVGDVGFEGAGAQVRAGRPRGCDDGFVDGERGVVMQLRRQPHQGRGGRTDATDGVVAGGGVGSLSPVTADQGSG
ncbi:hypothetical protein B1218_37295, partial [Pseudomonas ogarae]